MSILNLHKHNGVLYAFDGTRLINADGQVGEVFTEVSWADLVSAFNRLLVAGGTRNVVRMIDIDGTVRAVKATVDSEGFPLRAGAIESHRGVLFAGNVPESDGDHLARLRWSAFGQPENFTPFGAGNYQAFQDVGDNREPIVRLLSVGNDLYIFKRNSVHLAVGISSDFVGPETIREVTKQTGLVGPNAVTTDGNMVKFVSDGGIYSIVDRTVKPIYEDLWQQLEWRDRVLWSAVSITEDFTNRMFFMVFPFYNRLESEVFVKSENKNWSKWTWKSRNMSVVKAIPGEAQSYFGDFINGVYTLDDRKRTDFYTGEIIDSVWDSGWVQPNDARNLIRSLELLLRQEGDFRLKIEVFKDMNQIPEDVTTIVMNEKDPLSQTETAVTDQDVVATYNQYFHHFVDLTGSAYAVRMRFSTDRQLYSRFKILQLKLGFIKTGGI